MEAGNLYHGLKESDDGYDKFGEVYFSSIKKNKIKAWKMHTKMKMNLIVMSGEIRFNFIDLSKNIIERYEINLSINNYKRITVNPGLVFGFKGISDNNILVNIANIAHDDNEVMNYDIKEYNFI